MRTNDLRKSVIDTLESIKTKHGIEEIYFDEADERALYPHIVVSFQTTDLSDFFRHDYIVDIDVYSKDRFLSFEISDDIEDLFCNFSNPDDDILPTFFLVTKQVVDDPDKSIQHVVVRMQAQLYDNE